MKERKKKQEIKYKDKIKKLFIWIDKRKKRKRE